MHSLTASRHPSSPGLCVSMIVEQITSSSPVVVVVALEISQTSFSTLIT